MLRFKRRNVALGEGKVTESFDRMKGIASGLLMAGALFAAADVAAGRGKGEDSYISGDRDWCQGRYAGQRQS
jgi:hypothetical protein